MKLRRSCGARTRACSAGTLAGGRARPAVLQRGVHESTHDGIPLDISDNPLKLALVADPMIVRLPLPKWVSGASQKDIGFTCSRALNRPKKFGGADFRQQKNVDMIGHDHPSPKIVVPKLYATLEPCGYYLRNRVLAQVHRTGSRGIEVSVHPDKCLPGISGALRWVHGFVQASKQVPRHEKPLAFRVTMRETPTGQLHTRSVARGLEISLQPRRQESRRCTHECVRHGRHQHQLEMGGADR